MTLPAPDSILSHSRFRKVETKKAKFCLNARDAPQRILSRHFPNQLTNLLNCRLLEPIDNIPPAEFELTYYRQQDELAVAA